MVAFEGLNHMPKLVISELILISVGSILTSVEFQYGQKNILVSENLNWRESNEKQKKVKGPWFYIDWQKHLVKYSVLVINLLKLTKMYSPVNNDRKSNWI